MKINRYSNISRVMKKIKELINYLRGKTISLNNLEQKVIELARKHNKSYVSVSIELSRHLKCNIREKDEQPTYEFKLYIDGYKHGIGKTPQEAYDNLKKNIEQPVQVSKIEEIVI